VSGRNRVRASALLAVLGVVAIVYGPFLLHGGFASDDWAVQGYLRGGYGAAVRQTREFVGTRPLTWVLLPLPYAVFGTGNPRPLVVLAIVIALATAAAAYAFLREAGLARGHAFLVAVLFFLFPWSSSLRVWPTASLAELSVLLLLAGGLVALKGLRRHGVAAVVRHACAVACFVGAVLVYEAATPVVVLSGLLYAAKAGWAAARRRWVADLAALAGAFGWVKLNWTRASASVSDVVAFAPRFSHDAVLLLTRAVVPAQLGGTWPWVILVALLGIVGAALVVMRRLEDDDPERLTLRRWLLTAAAAAVALPFTWILFLASGELTPTGPGLDDRTNIGAALPLSLLVWSGAMLVVSVAKSVSLPGRTAGAALVPIAAALLLGGYAWQSRTQADEWADAARKSRQVLAAIRSLPLPPHTTVYTFGAPAQVAPRIPVFLRMWELSSAVRVDRDDTSLSAYPVYVGSRLVCGRLGVHARLTVLSERAGIRPDARYGHVQLLDVPSRRHTAIRSRAGCLSTVGRFRPGPLQMR
jgi:hypothetical protein